MSGSAVANGERILYMAMSGTPEQQGVWRSVDTGKTWTRFLLQELPARSVLRTMGLAAAETPLDSWEDTARAYWLVCVGVLARCCEAAGF